MNLIFCILNLVSQIGYFYHRATTAPTRPTAKAAAASIPVSLGPAFRLGVGDDEALAPALVAEVCAAPLLLESAPEVLVLLLALEVTLVSVAPGVITKVLLEEADEELLSVTVAAALQPPAENVEYTARSWLSWLVMTSGGAPISVEQLVAIAIRLEDCSERYEYISRLKEV